MVAQPAARAGATFLAIKAAGKFQAVKAAATWGWALRMPTNAATALARLAGSSLRLALETMPQSQFSDLWLRRTEDIARPGFHAADAARLGAQMARVRDLMRDARWRTLREIAAATGDPEASVSARLRDLRKRRHGAHCVESRRRAGAEARGVWEYRVGPANDITGGA